MQWDSVSSASLTTSEMQMQKPVLVTVIWISKAPEELVFTQACVQVQISFPDGLMWEGNHIFSTCSSIILSVIDTKY